MPLDRRNLIHALAAAPALAPFLALERAMAAVAAPPATLNDAQVQAAEAHAKFMEVPTLRMHGGETVSMLLYPGFTALDLVGPHYFFASMMGSKVELVTNQPTLGPVASDLGLAIQPTATLNTAFARPTVLFVPGGSMGTVAAMEHAPTLEYLVERAADARLITSVCTGSLVLGAAGLLKGRKATSHWVARDILAELGATPVDARIVRDGPVITGAGVSAGLDFALAVVEELRGRPYAQALMLQAEYAPAPPFPG
ncbi:MAG: DJ-1/PfpI family protein, partial [Phenylobacterium sp.]